MLNLLLISSCAAFLYALWEESSKVFLTVRYPIATRAIIITLVSSLGTWLAGITSVKEFLLYIFSSGFFASFLMKVFEFLSTPTNARPSRTRDVRLP